MKCLLSPLNIHTLNITLREILQTNIYPYEKSLEKPEEELFLLEKYYREKLHSEIKGTYEHISIMLTKLHDKYDNKTKKQLNPMSVQITDLSSKQSKNIQNELLIITSEHLYSEYNFERKLRDNISPSNQGFEK